MLRLNCGMLRAGREELWEGGEETFDSRARHLFELPRDNGLAASCADGSCEEDHGRYEVRGRRGRRCWLEGCDEKSSWRLLAAKSVRSGRPTSTSSRLTSSQAHSHHRYHTSLLHLTSTFVMTTIPARLAQRTQISSSFSEAHARSRALYRDFYRAAPEICAMYVLDLAPSTVRAKFREKFEENRHIKDLAVMDLLLFKGRIEYQETMNGWKQTPHVMNWFKEEEVSRELGESSPTAAMTDSH